MIENVLLEYDEKSGYALLLRRCDKFREYVVAYRYDPIEGDWQQGSYHETFATAAVDYSSCIGGPSLAVAPEDCFCTVRWCDEDLVSYLEDAYGKPYATDENVERCKDMMRGGRSLKDTSIEEGWAIIDAIVDPSLLVAES